MARTEVRGFSSEQQQAYRQLAGFFGGAEREYPAAAGQLVNVVGGLVGEQRTTREKLRDGMGNIDVGLALIGDWLKEVEADGFEVRFGIGGGTKKAIARNLVKFPSASDLIRVSGRIDADLQKQIPPLLSSFSRQIRGGLDVGLSPRQIVGGLVAESVGSRLSANGSANLREALNKPLGGHFEWIREALGIPDAATQPGFTAKEVVPSKVIKRDEAVEREELSPAEREFQRKKARIKRYLVEERGTEFLLQIRDIKNWEFVSEREIGGTEIWRPLRGVLNEEGVWLKKTRHLSGNAPADDLRKGTRFLRQKPGLAFVNVYAHAPLDEGDNEGIGVFDQFRHWELIDAIKGMRVERGKSGYWPESLPPLVRLKVLLAGCDCQDRATTRLPASTCSFLEPNDFIVQSDGTVRIVYAGVGDIGASTHAERVTVELAGLLCKLFYKEKGFEVRHAIYGYFHPLRFKKDQKLYEKIKLPPQPTLEVILRNSEMSEEVKRALWEFLNDVQGGYSLSPNWEKEVVLGSKEASEAVKRRILPIAQRLERQEAAARGEEIARKAREDAGRRVEEELKTVEKVFVAELEDLIKLEEAAAVRPGGAVASSGEARPASARGLRRGEGGGVGTEAEAVPVARAEGIAAPETGQQRFSGLVDEVKVQIQDSAADRGAIRDNLLEMFDLAAEITAADPSGEQRLIRGLIVLLRVAREKEIIFSAKTRGKTAAEQRDMVGALVAEAKTLITQSYFSSGNRERMGEVMRQLLDHTVALGSGDKMGTSLARLLRIAGGKQVKLGGGRK